MQDPSVSWVPSFLLSFFTFHFFLSSLLHLTFSFMLFTYAFAFIPFVYTALPCGCLLYPWVRFYNPPFPLTFLMGFTVYALACSCYGVDADVIGCACALCALPFLYPLAFTPSPSCYPLVGCYFLLNRPQVVSGQTVLAVVGRRACTVARGRV